MAACLALFTFLVGDAGAQKTYEWKLQSAWLTPITQDGLRTFAENVKNATNGRVNIKVYQANELVKIQAIRESVQSGAIELACEAGAYASGVIPEADVEFGLPFGWRTWDECWEAFTKYGLMDKVREAYAEKGLYYITVMPAGEYCLMSTKPVRKAEDLKGLKIRSWGLLSNILTSFGAAPATIPGSEQYMALQRGTVDATVYPVFVLDAMKIREVVKYVIQPSFISPPTINLYMNLDLWKGLPQEIKDAITKVSSVHQADMQKKYKAEGETAIENFKKGGFGEVIDLPEAEVKKLREASVKHWEEWAAKSPRLKVMVEAMKKLMADKGLTK